MVRARDAEAELNMPPGFRFHPTDEELVVHYLCRKAAQQRLPTSIIAEVDLYKYDPWQLPDRALFGNKEWYFFTPRNRKYPNGSRPNRAAGSGYWKATGADKPITPAGSGRPLGIKKALVFYEGKAPRGVKTNWIMHEYRLVDNNRGATANKKGAGGGRSQRLDDWVLCRLYNKKNNRERMLRQTEEASTGETMDSLEASTESLRTPESDVDSVEVYTDHDGRPCWRSLPFAPPQAFDAAPQAAPSGNPPAAAVQVGEGMKEDDEWFMGLNLDELQWSMMEFGGDPSLDLSCQDYYLTSLLSPQKKPYQANLPTF